MALRVIGRHSCLPFKMGHLPSLPVEPILLKRCPPVFTSLPQLPVSSFSTTEPFKMMETCLDQLRNQPRILIGSTSLSVALRCATSPFTSTALTDGQAVVLLCKFIRLHQNSRGQLAPLQPLWNGRSRSSLCLSPPLNAARRLNRHRPDKIPVGR